MTDIERLASNEWRQMRRDWREMDFDERSQLAARVAAHERAAAKIAPATPATPARKLMSRPFVTMTAAEIADEVARAIALARARGVIR